MNRIRFYTDTLWAGALIGLILPALGIFILYKIRFSAFSFNTLFETGIIMNLLKISLLGNLIPFFLFLYLQMDRASKGVLASTIACGVIILLYILF